MAEVLVLVDHLDGEVKKVTFELLTAAREIGSPSAVVVGAPGTASKLTLSVSKGGAPVTDLQPYLGAYGHLVALRDGDLAYLHVHPDGTPGDGRTVAGPQVTFFAEVPSAGSYRLYLDFQHTGTVRTAEFTAVAGAPAPTTEPAGQSAPPAPSVSAGHDEDGHTHG